MTLICCPIAIDSPSDLSEALACANEASEQGARLIEWRKAKSKNYPAQNRYQDFQKVDHHLIRK